MSEESAEGVASEDDKLSPDLTIFEITLQRFKQFKNREIKLKGGVSLIAGGNNSGKTSILHCLAVWEFCRTATIMERGDEGILSSATLRQGFGIGDDQFSPINVPSLKHLWTNLKSAKEDGDTDGYTLKIVCKWNQSNERELGFGLALANDRLFIKVVKSNLQPDEPTPRIAYLPPFAGITSREERINGAIRRRRIGEGLAGAVLRNLLLDMQQENERKRSALRNKPSASSHGKARTKISERDLRELRASDPWELLLQALRTVFGAELIVKDFREEYHTYIDVQIDRGAVEGYKLKRHENYNPRDIMVEGSGFLQWLSVYTLATTPDANILLFDEPDAHLHPSLQRELLEHLSILARSGKKQVLLATHSSEILRNSVPEKILEVRRGKSPRYFQHDHQKVGLLAGLGSDYAPRIDRIRKSKKIVFTEGVSDLKILLRFASTLRLNLDEIEAVEWTTTASHKDRFKLVTALEQDIPNIRAVSLRDRDDESIRTIGSDLEDSIYKDRENFLARKWRRRYIESYLILPSALAECTGKTEETIATYLRENHALAVGDTFTDAEAPLGLLDVRAKEILIDLDIQALDLVKHIPESKVCDDIKIFLDTLMRYFV